MVSIEAISGSKMLEEIATEDAVHPIQMRLWKKQLIEGAPATCLPGARRRRPKARACWERRVPPKGKRS
jgi:hypothetical protein